MAAARGRVLVRCDDDLEPEPDFVALHLAAHAGADTRPLGVVGLYQNVFPDTPYARAYGRPADARFREDAYRAPADTTWRYWAGNVSVTRDTADRVGPYDEGFRAYGWEDVDWGHRLHLLGVPVVLEPGLETTHRLSAVTAASRVERAWFSGAARRAFVAKHGRTELAPRPPDSVWTRGGRPDRPRAHGVARPPGGPHGGCRGAGAPGRLAHALVALLVEGASEAGYRHGSVADPTAV